MNIIHLNNHLSKEQTNLYNHINDIIGIERPFIETVKEIQSVVDGHNNTIRESTPIGQTPEYVFTLSAFPDDREIYIADHPTGSDFYILSL